MPSNFLKVIGPIHTTSAVEADIKTALHHVNEYIDSMEERIEKLEKINQALVAQMRNSDSQ